MAKKKSRRPRLTPATPLPPLIEGPRLLSRAEVLELVGVSAPTLWLWQRQGRFPRSKSLNGKVVWRSDVIERFVAALPTTRLKGDDDA
jgi:predicted DNA-binding transcriptional regulator AlpA